MTDQTTSTRDQLAELGRYEYGPDSATRPRAARAPLGPEAEAHAHAEEDLGRYRSDTLNKLDNDSTRKKKDGKDDTDNNDAHQ